MKITLPLPPNRGNARWHWRTEKRKKSDYYLRCNVSAKYEITLDELAATPFEQAKITVTLYTWSTMDVDNLMARLKWPVDWLVKADYIVNDSPDVLEWELPRQAIDRKNQRIEVELEELDV